MKPERSIFARLSANYTFLFVYLGIMAPYWAMWLKSRGLDPSEIGIIIAVPHILKIIVAPLISQAADHREEYWRPLLICTAASMFFSSFYFMAQDFWMLLLITVAVNLTWPAITPLLETITVSQSGRHKLSYGHIRTFGSASFILAAVLLGYFLKNNSVEYVMWAIYGSMILFFMAVLLLPRGNKRMRAADLKIDEEEKPIKSLLGDPAFVWFLVAIGLIQMSHGVFYSLGSIYWQQGGIDEDMIGLLWAVGVLAEIAVFIFMGNYIKRKPLAFICFFVGLLGAFRWFVMASTFSLPVLALVQIIHGFSFGATHLAAINYLGNKIPKHHAGTAQSLYTALPLGLGMAFSTYFGSLIYEYEKSGAYFAMSALCLFAAILSFLPLYRTKS